MMQKVLLSVEGQTEETFVRDILQPHVGYSLHLQPVLLKTRRVADSSDHKGGYVPYPRIEKEVRRLLGDSSAVAVTTMYDLYGLPGQFPGMAKASGMSGVDKATFLEKAFAQQIANHRFRPYLQVHEFEALLFADPCAACSALGGDASQAKRVADIARAFRSPEDIDDGVATAPSKRITGVFPGYAKVLHGPQITSAIGLARLSGCCHHFGEWLAWLQSLVP